MSATAEIASTPYVRVRDLEAALRAVVDGEVRFDPASRGAYSTDASNYRQVPLGVVVPRTVDTVEDAVRICREHRAPLVSRGGGTSLAGQACNVAVVVDWSKYCNGLVSVDAAARTCVVEPGIVLDELNARLEHHGLMFGPRPATHDHCTLGGMIGNDSCGSTAQAYGRTSDNVRRLEVLLYDGTRMWVAAGEDAVDADGQSQERAEALVERLRRLRDRWADDIRDRFPDIPRLVSGYALDALLPENGFNLARALVGSESTLVTVLRAELALVPRPTANSLVVLGYPDIASAADAVPRVVAHGPERIEAFDDRLIGYEKTEHRHQQAVAELPEGNGWLMVSFAGTDPEDTRRRAQDLADELASGDSPPSSQILIGEAEEQLWTLREDGLGATARAPDMPFTWPGWEDAAVPPERLGDYLRDFRKLLDDFGMERASVYGHFGQGCVHCRLPFVLDTADGIRSFREFLVQAAELVTRYGGSLSGEHGDGQARAEFLPIMFGERVVRAFEELKDIFDPDGMMNPGKVVRPHSATADLRLGTRWDPDEPSTTFSFPEDGDSFQRAVMRCVGVGKCRHHDGGVMCPSYMVTREEIHSTRGRSRLLFEMLDGHTDSPVTPGWRAPEVTEALDLCLACKGCKSDCPVGVDMATYKAEFLHHRYARRLRPRSHYSMGWLPAVARLAQLAPRTTNVLTQTDGIASVARRLGGIDHHRRIPTFATETLQAWASRRRPMPDSARGEVVLWPDTFDNHLTPAVGRAAVAVLEQAGYEVTVPSGFLCCGLTWITTGQLTIARRRLSRTLDALEPFLERGTPIVVLEPSCLAVFRSDGAELLPGDRRMNRLQGQAVSLAELLEDRTDGWSPPSLGGRAIVQTHCHQHAIIGTDRDQSLLRRIGVQADFLDSGCCGLAGNFGFEDGHYDVSRAIGERVLLPAVRAADPDTLVLADGFSCRTQIEQGDTGRRPLHLAEVLAAAVRHEPARAERPDAGAAARVLVPAGALAAPLASVVALRLLRRARAGRSG